MVVLGLDASTSATGWSILTDGELIECGLVKPKSGDWRERIKIIRDEIKDIIQKYGVESVYMEDVPLEQKNINTLYKLSVLQGWLCSLFDSLNIKVEMQTPVQWRSKLQMFDGTNQGKQRKHMKEKAVEMANSMFDLELKKSHDDIAEAILIGYSHFIRKGFGKS